MDNLSRIWREGHRTRSTMGSSWTRWPRTAITWTCQPRLERAPPACVQCGRAEGGDRGGVADLLDGPGFSGLIHPDVNAAVVMIDTACK